MGRERAEIAEKGWVGFRLFPEVPNRRLLRVRDPFHRDHLQVERVSMRGYIEKTHSPQDRSWSSAPPRFASGFSNDSLCVLCVLCGESPERLSEDADFIALR